MTTLFGSATDPATVIPYAQDMHEDWLVGSHTGYPYNVKAYLEAAMLAGSPYAIATSIDPNEYLDEAATRWKVYRDALDGLSMDDYTDAFSKAKTHLDAYIGGATEINALVDEFTEKNRDQLYSAINSFAGAMFDVRATENSQFQVALALLHADNRRQINEFRANLEMQQIQAKNGQIVQLAGELMKVKLSQLEMLQAGAAQDIDLEIRRLVANREWFQDEIRLAESDATYELELFKYGSDMLAALSGVPRVTQRMDKPTSALAGMMASAGAAVSVGSALAAINPMVGIAAGLGTMALGGLTGWGQGVNPTTY